MGLDILAFVVPIILILVVVVIFLSFVPLGLWISAISAGVKVSIFSLVGMRLRRVRADKIIRPLIKAQKAGMNVNANQLESHLLSGGRVDNVVDGHIEQIWICPLNGQLPLTWRGETYLKRCA